MPNKRKGFLKCDRADVELIVLQSTSHTLSSNIFLSRLSLYMDEINGFYDCGFHLIDQLLIRLYHLS
jgi:hypothetical protein